MATLKDLRQKLRELRQRWEQAQGHPKTRDQIARQIREVESRIQALQGQGATEGTQEPVTPPLPVPPPIPEAPAPVEEVVDTTAAEGDLAIVMESFGLDPSLFGDYIKQAVIEGWSASYLLAQIAQTPAFKALFPGLETLQAQGYSLPQALGRFSQLKKSYFDVLSDMGAQSLVTLDQRTIGMLISNGKSPDEFASILRGVQMAKDDPEWLQRLSQLEGRQVTFQETAEFLAGLGNPELYDKYEAVSLLQTGIDAPTARRLARAIGEPGEQGDIRAVLDTIREWDSAAMQEVRASGITQEQVILAASQPQLTTELERKQGTDAFFAVQQTLRNRQARTQANPQSATSLLRGRPVSGDAPALQSI